MEEYIYMSLLNDDEELPCEGFCAGKQVLRPGTQELMKHDGNSNPT